MVTRKERDEAVQRVLKKLKIEGVNVESGTIDKQGKKTVQRRGSITGGGGFKRKTIQERRQEEARAKAEAQRLAEEKRAEALRLAEEKRQADIQAREQAKAERELRAIEKRERELREAGARTRIRESVDVKTGEDLRIETTRRGGTTIQRVVRAGQETVTQINPKGGSGSPQVTRQVTSTGQDIKPKPKQTITKETVPPQEISFTQSQTQQNINQTVPDGFKTFTFQEPQFGTQQFNVDIDGVTPISRSRTININVADSNKESIRRVGRAFEFPLKATGVIGNVVGERVSSKFPEQGFNVKLPSTFEFTIDKPQTQTPQFEFSPTTNQLSPINQNIVVPSQEREAQIFQRQRVKEGVSFGFQTGTIIAQPGVFAGGFISEGSKTVLDDTKTPIERGLGFAETTFGFVPIVGRTRSILKTPVTKITPTRKPKTPEAVEVQQQIIIGDQETKLSLFNIRGEIKPPTIKLESTIGNIIKDKSAKAFEKLFVGNFNKPVTIFRRPPKITKQPSINFQTFTPKPVIGNNPPLTVTRTGFKNFFDINKIKGTSSQLDVEDIPKLSKLEEFTLRRRIEERIGRPVSKENLQKLLREDEQIFVSNIENIKGLRITPKNDKLIDITSPSSFGKRTDLRLGLSTVEKQTFGKTRDVFDIETTFKNINKPFARASGKTQDLFTTLVRLKPQDLTPKDFTFKITSNLKQQQKLTQAPKTTLAPLPKTQDTSTRTIIGQTPRTPIQESKIIELETPSTITSPQIEEVSPSLIRSSTQSTGQIESSTQEPKITSFNVVDVGLIPQQRDKTLTTPLQTPSSGTRQQPKQDTTLIQQPKLISPPTQQPERVTRPTPVFIPRITKFPFDNQRPPRDPRKIIPFKFPRQGFGTSRTNIFSVQERRRGKFRPIGFARTGREAVELGTRRVSRNLSASFRVTGKGLLPNAPRGFTRKGNIFTEKKGLRLDNPLEVFQLKKSKSKSKKKKR